METRKFPVFILFLSALLLPLGALADNDSQGRSGGRAPAHATQEQGSGGGPSPTPSPVPLQNPSPAPYSQLPDSPLVPQGMQDSYPSYGQPWETDQLWNSLLGPAPQQTPQYNYNYNIDINNTPQNPWPATAPSFKEQQEKKSALDALIRKVAKEAAAQKGGRAGAAEGNYSSTVDAPRFHLKPRPDDFALLVGIESYPSPLPRALFARRDAQAAAAHLRALGWPAQNVVSLLGEQATLAKMRAYLEDWLPKNVVSTSRVFFYFSGHGAPSLAGEAYLVPWDGSPNYLEKTAFPLKRLYADLAALRARSVTAALDSCFSGMGGRSVLPQGARPLVMSLRGLPQPGGRTALFAATGPREVTGALDSQGHGIFTYYFLDGIDRAVSMGVNPLRARWLFGYLKPLVERAAALQNLSQDPRLEGDAGQVILDLR